MLYMRKEKKKKLAGRCIPQQKDSGDSKPDRSQRAELSFYCTDKMVKASTDKMVKDGFHLP